MQNKCTDSTSYSFSSCNIFLMDNYDGEENNWLIEKKLDAMVNREVYSKSQTAPTEEERKFSENIWTDREYRRTFDGKGSF